MDILFLSISMGAGHLKAAEALNEYVKGRYPHSRTLIVDTFKYISPAVHKFFVDGYLGLIRHKPAIYSMLYKMSEQSSNVNILSMLISRMLALKIERLIEEFHPSIIVCTHPFPLQMVSCLKAANKINVPLVAVFTDYANHPFWLQDNVDAYVVGHEKIKKDMIAQGILPGRVLSCGIPVSPRFLKTTSKKTARKNLGLYDKFTLLIMGGSLGFGEIEKTLLALINNFYENLQIIVVTGKNHKLKNRLDILNKNNRIKLLILGYTDNVSELMDASDILITKPGGMTVTEALVKGLPMIIASTIPGQEERNADFLINSGVALRTADTDTLISVIDDLIKNPEKINNMKKKCINLIDPKSGQRIMFLMENLIRKHGLNQISSLYL